MIRELTLEDIPRVFAIHQANGLPENCFPDLVIKDAEMQDVIDPLYMVNAVVERDGHPVMASFLKATSEVYVVVDHSHGTPEDRWQMMQELCAHMVRMAFEKGLDEMTCWLPRELERSFEQRLELLGFVKSPWQSYTLKLKSGDGDVTL